MLPSFVPNLETRKEGGGGEGRNMRRSAAEKQLTCECEEALAIGGVAAASWRAWEEADGPIAGAPHAWMIHLTLWPDNIDSTDKEAQATVRESNVIVFDGFRYVAMASAAANGEDEAEDEAESLHGWLLAHSAAYRRRFAGALAARLRASATSAHN